MKNPFLVTALSAGFVVFSGCETIYNMMDALNEAHTYNSSAIAGGGAVAGKDYITGLAPCEDARTYFSKEPSTQAEKVTVTPGDDKGTGVEWTDDGGIVIPPGVTIEFVNKGYCMDPHLPAPKSGEEIQLVKTSSLLPNKMRGTYKNLMQRAAAGDEEIKSNMQRLVWALRTAGSDDAMATYLTDRQKEILEENASNEYERIDSFDGLFDKLVDDAKKQLAQTIADVTSVRIGNVTYNAFDLMDPDKGMEKVAAHMDALAAMSKNLPVAKTGFNYGQIENGIYTDIKGNGVLSFNAKIANATSQPYTFYPYDYVGQVGSGDNSSAGTFYATSSTSMRQRTTMTRPNSVDTRVEPFATKLPKNANGTAPIFPSQGAQNIDNKQNKRDRQYERSVFEKQYVQAIRGLAESGEDVDSTVERWLSGFQENVAFYDEQLVRAESQLQIYKDTLSYKGYEIPQWLAETCLYINATPRVVAQGVEIATGEPIGTGMELFLTGVSDAVKGDNLWWSEDERKHTDDAKKYLDANLALSGSVIDEVSKGAGKAAGGVVAGATTVGILVETASKQQTISKRYAAKEQAELSVKSIWDNLEYNQAKYDALQSAYRKYKKGNK